MDAKCKYRKEGYCTKWRDKAKCEPSTQDWCDGRLSRCDISQMCEKSSIFGNNYFYLDDEDIEALKNGKILFYVDEYGIFIGYREGDSNVDKS